LFVGITANDTSSGGGRRSVGPPLPDHRRAYFCLATISHLAGAIHLGRRELTGLALIALLTRVAPQTLLHLTSDTGEGRITKLTL